MNVGRVLGKKVLVTTLASLAMVAPAAQAEKVTITLFTRDLAGNNELYKYLIEQFQAQNPDIQVKWEIATGDWVSKLSTMLVAGVAPDIFELWGWFATDWAQNGLLLDLRPFVRRDMTRNDIADIFPGDWEATFLRFGKFKGEQYAFPRYTNVGVTYYNVDKLNNAGLEDIYTLAQKGGWTFDVFREYARKLTYVDEKGQRRFGADIKIGGVERLTGLVASFGGRLFSFDTLAYALDEPNALAALQFHQRLMHDDQSIPRRTAPGDLKNFSAGAIAIDLEGSHAVPYRIREIGNSFSWKMAPWPAGPGGRISWAAGDKYAINRQTKHPEAAWKFLKFLTSTQGAIAHARYAGLAPYRRSAMRAYIEMYPNVNAQSHAETAITARVFEEAQVPESRKVSELITAAYRRVLDQGVPVATAMGEVKDAVNALLAPYR